MKNSKMMALTLAISVVTVAMIVAGCSTISTPSPTPVPSATPTPVPATPTPVPATPTPAPITDPVERTSQLFERYIAGLAEYNEGISYVDNLKNMTLINASDYTRASQYMDTVADKMESAEVEFEAMLFYASTSQEALLSQKWTETADLYAKSYRNISLAYTEYAYQLTTHEPGLLNLVRYNYLINIANSYSANANESRKQAAAIGDNITFEVPASTQ